MQKHKTPNYANKRINKNKKYPSINLHFPQNFIYKRAKN